VGVIGQDRQRYHIRVRVLGKKRAERRKRSIFLNISFILPSWIGWGAKSLSYFPFSIANLSLPPLSLSTLLPSFFPCARAVVCTVWAVYITPKQSGARRHRARRRFDNYYYCFVLFFSLPSPPPIFLPQIPFYFVFFILNCVWNFDFGSGSVRYVLYVGYWHKYRYRNFVENCVCFDIIVSKGSKGWFFIPVLCLL